MHNITFIQPQLMNTTALYSPTMQFKGGSNKLWGTIIGVVAAIAIPFVAPALAGAIFGSTSIVSSAITGAGLGALAGAGGAALSGGDIMSGALYGAAGGAAAGAVGAWGQGATLMGSAAAPGAAAAGAAAGAPTQIAPGVAGAAGMGSPIVGAAPGAGLGTSAGIGSDPTNVAGAPNSVAVGGQPTMMTKLTDSLLNAAPQMIGQVVRQMAGADQAAYLAQLEAEMEQFKNQDQAAYAQRQALYQQVLAEANNVDPAFQSQLEAAKVARQQSKQYEQVKDDLATGNLSENASAAEARRYAVESPLDRHAAGAAAFTGAEQRRAGLLSQASGMIPNPSSAGLQMTNSMYQLAGQKADDAGAGAGNLAAQFLLPFQAEKAKKDATQYAGLYNGAGVIQS